MRKTITAAMTAVMLILSGCSKNAAEVIIDIGEVGKVDGAKMMNKQEGIRSLSHVNDTLVVNVVKDGTYFFYAEDENGEEVKIVMTVMDGEVSVETEGGEKISFTVK